MFCYLFNEKWRGYITRLYFSFLFVHYRSYTILYSCILISISYFSVFPPSIRSFLILIFIFSLLLSHAILPSLILSSLILTFSILSYYLSVLSTIAVAISPDGETVATSHGDHTIKIFKYYSGENILQEHSLGTFFRNFL